MWIRTAAVVLVGVALCGCRPPQAEPPADVTAEIQTANDQFSAAFAAQDAAALANLYTAQAQLLPPNSDFINGREAIETFWQGAMDAGVAEATLTTEEAMGTDSMAVEVGRYEMSSADGSTIDEGKYIVWWQRTPAGWRLHRDIWNSSRPAS
ncbi:MAG: SgcJ/EcaC family oxidoreductase [Gemmatimonadetes bacterium]|nr:SgcJ/EcaC family oxidoreductase [Gemmatimonadota bacterium]